MTTAHDPTDPVGKADTSARDNARATPEAVVAAIVAHLVVASPAGSEAVPDPVARARADSVGAAVSVEAAEAVVRDSVAAAPWDAQVGVRAGLVSTTDLGTKNASGCPSRPSPTSSTRTTRS